MKVKSRISRIALIRLYDYATTIMMANGDSNDFLEELVRLLKSPLLPVQSTIAREIGEDQPFVSNASRGILKRVTTRVTKLYKYASWRIKAEDGDRQSVGVGKSGHDGLNMEGRLDIKK